MMLLLPHPPYSVPAAPHVSCFFVVFCCCIDKEVTMYMLLLPHPPYTATGSSVSFVFFAVVLIKK